MPVQFLSGGGGTSDVRTTFAAPVYNTGVFPVSTTTTQLLNTFTIPANYFQVNDCLSFTTLIKKITSTGITSNKAITFTTRMGTTGTISDTIVGTTTPNFVENANITEFCFNITGYANIKTIGSSGTCFTSFHTGNALADQVFFSNNGLKTIDTTVPLYITVYATITMNAGQSATFAPTASSISVGF